MEIIPPIPKKDTKRRQKTERKKILNYIVCCHRISDFYTLLDEGYYKKKSNLPPNQKCAKVTKPMLEICFSPPTKKCKSNKET